MLKKKILEDLKKAVEHLGLPADDIFVSISQKPIFGDYSTNVVLQLSKQKVVKSKQSPEEIAKKILSNLSDLNYLEKVEIAGGGFINFFIKNEQLIKNISNAEEFVPVKSPQKILVEYGHVNPLKEVHIGHLRTFILGESICRILESVGHKVFRANYQGDIGLHIAKAIWGMKKSDLPSQQLTLVQKAEFMGRSYAEGNRLYDEDPGIKKEIDQITALLYQKDPKLAEIYRQVRQWSLDYFEPIYELLGVKYDRCFFESEVFEEGKKIVMENLGKVFKENEGAIIFPGEQYGLHNRVFVTSAGHSTYEGKEMGLAKLEYDSFNYDQSIHVVGSEQEGYFQVVIKAIELVFPHLKSKKQHLSYGMVDIKEGKMSSREGNVVTVDDLVSVVSEKVREVMKDRIKIDQAVVKKIALGAIKFSYLKFSPSPNMVFDLEQSVSLDGDSGPYIQYTYARIQSVLRKANLSSLSHLSDLSLDKEERLILRQLLYFSDIVEEVANLTHTNLLASYLVELSKLYNLFYQQCRIIGSNKEQFRLKLSLEVGQVLKKGLYLLGIDAPERM